MGCRCRSARSSTSEALLFDIFVIIPHIITDSIINYPVITSINIHWQAGVTPLERRSEVAPKRGRPPKKAAAAAAAAATAAAAAAAAAVEADTGATSTQCYSSSACLCLTRFKVQALFPPASGRRRAMKCLMQTLRSVACKVKTTVILKNVTTVILKNVLRFKFHHRTRRKPKCRKTTPTTVRV